MPDLTCPRCAGPAVRVEQTGALSCARQCNETLSDELRRMELEGLAVAIAQLVGLHTPKGYIFTVILASASASDGVKIPGAMAYASSAQRADSISMLREMADKLASERPS